MALPLTTSASSRVTVTALHEKWSDTEKIIGTFEIK